MKKFSYRLAPVLKSREDSEEKAILDQAAAQKEYLEKLGELEKIKKDLHSACDNENNETTANEFMTRWMYIDFLKNSIKRQEAAVEAARREMERKRKALIQARKEKLVLQKHRDRIYHNYVAELHKWEEKLNDDQCTALVYRKKG